MKVYLAGPMRGIPEFNFPTFKAAATFLRALGHEVISPAELDEAEGTTDCTMRHFMQRDLTALLACDGIVLLPGWSDSKGAMLERHAAQVCGLRVLYLREGRLYAEV